MSAMERTTYRHPLFLSDLQDQPDPREFEPFAVSQQTSILTRLTSILTRVVVGGLVVSAFAIMIAVFNSDVTRVLVDKTRASMDGANRDQSASQVTSNQPAARQILLNDDPARASDPVTRASGNSSAPQLGTASRDDMASDDRAVLQKSGPGRTSRE